MVRSDTRWLRGVTIGVVAALALGACGGSTATTAPPAATTAPATTAPVSGAPATTAPSSAAPTGETPTAGGTIYILTQADQWNQLDPQRAYTGEDMAFFSGTIYRSLTAYKFSPDPTVGTSLTPDLATDLGTATNGGKTWAFTLRDGVTFQDGSPITCADVAYGVSRTFATDVINQGPTYAIAYLDIPSNADGSSQYPGPYKATADQQALFDKAVACSADGKTVTFSLNKPVADFNYTVTLGFSPVPKAADTGETYGSSTGRRSPRAPTWSRATRPATAARWSSSGTPSGTRPATPTASRTPTSGKSTSASIPRSSTSGSCRARAMTQYAIQYGNVQPENLATIFTNPETPTAAFTGRAISGFDPYSNYLWINVKKVPNVKIRQAMAVALDRSAMLKNAGGDFAGTYADGLIKPNIGPDYAPTGFWTTFFGQPVPDTGDPVLAKKLISESGEAAPTLTFNFPDTPVWQKNAAIVIASLGLAGITVKPAPIEPGKYYSVVFDPASAGDFGRGGWGADWPNASTVIPPLLTVKGGWDLSQLDDPAFNAKVDAALTQLDRPTQEKQWQALNTEAAQNVYTIPTTFGLSQTIAGTKIGSVYRWAAYGSWPYGTMYVKP